MAASSVLVALRRIPTFLRLGLGWWLVLVAWPLSRPWTLYGMDGITVEHVSPGRRVALIAWSLGHALLAGWVLVRVLRRWDRRPTPASSLLWTIWLAFFAIDSWWLVWTIRVVCEGRASAGDVAGKLVVGMVWLPCLVLTGMVATIWPVLVLSWFTALYFPRIDGAGARATANL
jgi:hypothetical protein